MRKFSLYVLLVMGLSAVKAQNSVLREGDWIKVAISSSGIYRIDQAFLVSHFGRGILDVDPSTIKVFGNGGRMLPQANDESRPFDLIENAISTSGFEDGSLDNGDYLLFYGEGPNAFHSENNQIFYEENVYSSLSYYFLTFGGDPGLRIAFKNQLSGSFPTIDRYDALLIHENSERNILKEGLLQGGSGREWYGEVFQLTSNSSQNFSFELPGFTGNAVLTLSSLGQSFGPSSFTVLANGEEIGTQDLRAITPIEVDQYDDRGRLSVDNYTITTASTNRIDIGLQFNRFEGGTSLARLDRLEVRAERDLALYGNQTAFRSLSSLGSTSINFPD